MRFFLPGISTKKLMLIFSLLFTGLAYSQADTSLTFSEIMFIPQSGNNEFIELYNLSFTDTINLNNYRIKYHTSNPDIITSAGYGTLLPPRSFAIILEGDYDFENGIYNNLIPPEALILKISDNAFGTTGMSNTEARTLWLINPSNDTLDVYTYSANNATGYSDEKIVMSKNNSSSNWANSQVFNGTPGFRNSVTQLDHDLDLGSVTILPVVPVSGDDVEIFVKVKNRGLNTAASYTIEIFNDINFDSTGTPNELIFSQMFNNLLPGDSITVSTIMQNLQVGIYQVIGKVNYALDEDTLNNKKIRTFNVFEPGAGYNDIVINEIMYAPSGGEPEWVELFNRSSATINIKKWTLSDEVATAVITNQDVIVLPDEFIVLSKDSSIFNFHPNIPSRVIVFNLPILNNTGDAVVLKDSLGIIIDSLYYLSSWGGSSGGRSLERISTEEPATNQNNWGTSINPAKSTPGYLNSLTPKDHDLRIISFKPDFPFGILGESINFTLLVKNNGLMTTGPFTTKLFYDVNADSIPQPSELIGELSGSSLIPGDSSFFYFSTNNFSLGSNHFISLVEYTPDQDTTNNIAFAKVTGVQVNEDRNDLVINEFMYAPTSPEPEWIEIFNRSSKVIDLKNYKIADDRDTVRVITQSTILNPGEYFVIASDSSIINFYNIPSGFAVKNFSALNNTGDKVILLDSLNRTIDSLEYRPAWGGTGGKSLERISTELSSIDSTNWKTTLSRYKGTPGYINSVSEKDYDIQLSAIVFSPPFPLFGDEVNVAAKIINKGRLNNTFDLKLMEDTNLDSIPDVVITILPGLFLAAGDSSVISFNHSTGAIFSPKGFYAEAAAINDQDTSNNYLYNKIEPGYPPQSIVVNEIMYAPLGGEPEWVELLNRTEEPINLKNWRVSDVVTTPATATITSDVIIPSGGYLVLARDSSIFNYHRFIPSEVLKINLPVLNNDADGVVLRDNRGQTIDSVFYSSSWGGTGGFSLERIDSEAPSNLAGNWGSSLDIEQSTPGRVNSVAPKEFDLLLAEVSFDPRFPVPGDDVLISAKIRNTGSAIANQFSVEFLFDSDGDLIPDQLLGKTDSGPLNSGDSITITSPASVMNVMEDILTAVRVIYPNDEDTLNNYVERMLRPGFAEKSILINEVMYAPTGGEPEWFEIVNVSGDTLNLKNWAVSDVLTTPTKNFLTNDDFYVEPGEYLLVTKDTSIFFYHPDIDVKVLYANFGTLGNTSDGVVIYDFRDGIIDSLFYKSSWGGRNGYSLERISLEEATNDSSNWLTSLSPRRSTPGKPNSIVTIPPYSRGTLVINEIMYDPSPENNEFIEFIVDGPDTVNIGGWRIEDEKGNFYRLSDTSFAAPPGVFLVLAADSTIFNYPANTGSYFSIINVSNLGLINTGELILLKDARGSIIDSVWYSDKWHNKNITSTKNRSLEKINPLLNGNDPLNWSTSVSVFGATPGEENSIFSQNLNTEAKISVSPNPFSPDNDGFEDFTVINYNLTQPIAQVRIKIFDSKGRLVRTLLNNQPSGSKGSVIFDGLDDGGSALRIGIYIIFLEALNENSGVIESLKLPVVVARKLR